jgi:hypothetical protein
MLSIAGERNAADEGVGTTAERRQLVSCRTGRRCTGERGRQAKA